MRPARFAFVSAVVLGSSSLAACNPFGLESDWTRGERGHTRWQISDGLCPGFGGGCALDVPLAVGASVRLVIDGVDGVPLTVTSTGGALEHGGVDTGEDRDASISVVAVDPGTARLEISDVNGVIDAASLGVRRATRLDCGTWPVDETLRWNMAGLEVRTDITLPTRSSASSSSGALNLVCRAMDDAGPLLSERAISWEVIEGEEVIALADDLFLSASVVGARVTYEAPRPGSARVRATIGEVSQELTITIE